MLVEAPQTDPPLSGPRDEGPSLEFERPRVIQAPPRHQSALASGCPWLFRKDGMMLEPLETLVLAEAIPAGTGTAGLVFTVDLANRAPTAWCPGSTGSSP